MGQMQMDHDADLRARMRSRPHANRSQYLQRTNYQTGLRSQPGQDVVFRTEKLQPKPQADFESLVVRPEPVPEQPIEASQATKRQQDYRLARQTTYERRASPVFSWQPVSQIADEPAQAKSFNWSTSNILTGMAIFVFFAGLVAAWNGWTTNQHIAAQAERVSSQAESSDDAAAPSTDKPSDGAVSSYAVAPTLPRYIDISSLGVHARVMPMGVNSKNQLRAPGNVYDAGWYNASAKPGEPGAMLVDGHISSWDTKGVFYGINKLKAGDMVSIVRGDGVRFNYRVRNVAVVPADQVDMAALLISGDNQKPGLNLISCFGDVIPGTNEFDKRVIVTTVLE